MNHVPLWTFLGSISQIMSRFNFEKVCFLDKLVLRLATEYSAIVIYPFQLSYECFKGKNPNAAGLVRPLIQQILNAIQNTILQNFLDGLKCVNLPANVLHHHLYNFIHSKNHSKSEQQQLKEGFENVFDNPKRGKLPNNIQPFKDQFTKLMKMFGMLKFFVSFF